MRNGKNISCENGNLGMNSDETRSLEAAFDASIHCSSNTGDDTTCNVVDDCGVDNDDD